MNSNQSGAVGGLTLTIADNDVYMEPAIFSDGFENGNTSEWSGVVGLVH